MEFKEVIKKLRTNKKMTQSELAKSLDISPTTVSGWERGANYPTMDRVVHLSDFFEVPINTFFSDKEFGEKHEVVQVPVIGSIACGDPITAAENVDEYREVSPTNLPSGDIFYLKASGDSMHPLIPDGSYVLIKEQPDVENGEIAAVLVNGDEEATLKRVRKVGDSVLLEAINSEYEPIIINGSNPARIIGKAVKVEFDL